MIWEMVTGRLPWQHPDPAVLYHLQRTVIPARPPESEMPSRWADVLISTLSVDPAARPQSARELAVALASALPAVGRVPSGAEILAGLAPHFVSRAAPGDETVRNASGVDRIGPLLWPPRETASDALREPPSQEVRATPGAGDPLAWPAAAVRAATPVMLETTLSAATGITSLPSARRARPWKLAFAAAGATAIATLAIAAVLTRTGAGAASSPIANPESPDTPTRAAEAPDAPPSGSAQPDARGAVSRGEPRDAEHEPREDALRVEAPASVRGAAARSAPVPSAVTRPAPVSPAVTRPAPTVPAKRAVGELAVYVTPWAIVHVNGRQVGPTPYRAKLPAGSYRVRMQNEDTDRDETVIVTVAPGTPATIRRTW